MQEVIKKKRRLADMSIEERLLIMQSSIRLLKNRVEALENKSRSHWDRLKKMLGMD